jgi:hypothetical protein
MGITQRTISADPGRFKIALGRVRAAFASVPTAGARAAVVAGASEADRSCLLEQASVELSEAGFEIHRFGETTRLEETSSSLVDRLIDTLIERYGVEAIRSAIPIRARELRARVGSQRPISNPQRQNPLAARQYDEQLWRSTADLLAELAKRRALALVVDGGEQAATVPIRVVLPLLRLLDSAAVFILCSVRSDGSAQPERDEMFDPRIDFVQLAPVLDRRRMNELLVSRGVAALPVVLADALLSHVRADETALETITAWLQMERERGEHNPDRRMKRVRPDTESRHSKLGVA